MNILNPIKVIVPRIQIDIDLIDKGASRHREHVPEAPDEMDLLRVGDAVVVRDVVIEDLAGDDYAAGLLALVECFTSGGGIEGAFVVAD